MKQAINPSMYRSFAAIILSLVLASCQSALRAPIVYPDQDVAVLKAPATTVTGAYADLPGWSSAGLMASLEAFRRSCARLAKRPRDDYVSSNATWAGTVGEWAPACAALARTDDESIARATLESLFIPLEALSPDGKSRFTGYFEPTYEARRTPVAPYTEPVPALPADLVPNGASPLQRLPNGSTRPYPSREEITRTGVVPVAYAHPSDVFFLQIQGSGRLTFPDGSTIRAVYAAHNGHTFKSTANWLIQTGRITAGQASMQGIRAWMDRAGLSEARIAMNQNPRFVFFRAKPEGDPALGPVGAQGVALTPLGSLAVDTDIQPLGVPMFVQTSAPGLGGSWSGLLISQDTGGAIKGAVRGDLYFGTGPDAGARAGTMNAPGRLWVLLPRSVGQRLIRAMQVSDRPVLGDLPLAP